MQEFLKNLNEKQLEAVKSDVGPILVLAGAGSGKTKVLTSRIASLVTKNISPNDILAVTFTNKAAKEMQQRLSVYLGENVVKRMWVGTFHNICGRILRNDIENYKTKDGRSWSKNYVIYDDTDTKTIIKDILKSLNLDEKVYEYKSIKSAISNAKNKMQDAYAYATYAKDHYSERISQIYYEYEKRMALNNAIDFDDMLMLTVNLLKANPEIKEKYQKRFKHILVDEFQDTNKAQYDLINLLYPTDRKDENTSLFCVGDIDQSIYSWRGADFKIILNFQNDYENTKLIKLEQNYRSTEVILNAANNVIQNNEERLEKNLYSNKGEGGKITFFEAKDDYNESRYLAKKIEDIGNYDNIAILYRTNAQSRAVEEALITAGIPYKIVGGLKFYDRKEIKDALAYLKLIYNHNDNASFKRIINVPKRKIGDTTIKKLDTFALDNDISLYETLKRLDEIEDISAKTKSTLANFHTLIEELTSKQMEYILSEFVSYMLEFTGYLGELRAEDNVENKSRLDNLQEFINVVKDFESDDFNLEQADEDDLGILGNFLSQVALVSDLDETKEEDSSSVTLMTLHSAKGLEYKIVFLIGLEEGLFPSIKKNSYHEEKSALEEERRLMYVGITRAMDKLYLTCASSRRVWGNWQNYPKSRFLDEIPQNLIEFDSTQDMGYDGKSSFSSVVSRIKQKAQNQNYDNYQKKESSMAASSSKPTNSLLSSIERIKKSAQKFEAQKTNENKIDYKRINAKVIKKKEAENKPNLSISEMIQKAKEKAKTPTNINTTRKEGLFPIGTRVFHSTFGIGNVVEIIQENNNSNYIVDFTKAGKKTLDSMTADLKTF